MQFSNTSRSSFATDNVDRLTPGKDDAFPQYAAILFACLVAFYIVERCVRTVVYSLLPKMCARLVATEKERTFFGVFMGLLITLVSTPSCSIAAFEAWTSPQAVWHLTPHAQVCAAARGVLWVSDLNRLDKYPQILLHHTFAISGLLMWLTRHWSHIVILTIMATLVSEVGGDIIFLISAYRDTLVIIPPAFQRFRRILVTVNAWQYGLIRGAGIVVVTWKMYTDPEQFNPSHIAERLFGYSLLLAYTTWVARYVLSQVRKSPSIKAQQGNIHSLKN